MTVPHGRAAQGRAGQPIVLDIDGRTHPRYTTIYDAALLQRNQQPARSREFPIPILCHQPHMRPVAVCRMCVVQIYRSKRGKRSPERKLLPACQHQVKEGMEVFTMNDPGPDGERVRESVGVADRTAHRRSSQAARRRRPRRRIGAVQRAAASRRTVRAATGFALQAEGAHRARRTAAIRSRPPDWSWTCRRRSSWWITVPASCAIAARAPATT